MQLKWWEKPGEISPGFRFSYWRIWGVIFPLFTGACIFIKKFPINYNFNIYFQDRDKYNQFKQHRDDTRQYDVSPYVVFIGDLEWDGNQATEENTVQDNIEYQSDEDWNSIVEEQSVQFPEVFVVIQDQECKIKSNKIIDAIESCFKSIVSLGNWWPPECRHIWEFISVRVFNFNALRNYACVNNLLLDLRLLTRPQALNCWYFAFAVFKFNEY